MPIRPRLARRGWLHVDCVLVTLEREKQMETLGSITLGDLHLVSQTWRSRPEVQGDSHRALAHVVGLCIAKKYSLKLAGDAFDSTGPSAADVDAFRAQMDLMRQHDLPVFAIQGQHDKTIPPWCVAIHPWVQYVSGKVFEPLMGILTWAHDYVPAAALPDALACIPPNVTRVMLHQAARQVLSFPGAWNFDPAWLPEWVTVAILGDIHMPVEFVWGPKTAGYYTGSAHTLEMGEPWQKSVIVESMEKGFYEIRRELIPSRRYMPIAVATPEDIVAMSEKVNSIGLNDPIPPVFVVEYSTDFAVTDDHVQAALASRAARAGAAHGGRAYIWTIPTGGMRVDSAPEGEAKVDADLSTVLAACTPDGELHGFVYDLLTKSPTSQVIADMRKTMGVDAALGATN